MYLFQKNGVFQHFRRREFSALVSVGTVTRRLYREVNKFSSFKPSEKGDLLSLNEENALVPMRPRLAKSISLCSYPAFSSQTLLRVLHKHALSFGFSQAYMSTTASMDGFTDVEYNQAVESFLDRVEYVVDELNDSDIVEVQCRDGVLTIDTRHRGSYVLNKQAAKRQLWLSSPLSGPHHYDMIKIPLTSTPDSEPKKEEIRWLSERDEHDLQKRLEDELESILKRTIRL